MPTSMNREGCEERNSAVCVDVQTSGSMTSILGFASASSTSAMPKAERGDIMAAAFTIEAPA